MKTYVGTWWEGRSEDEMVRYVREEQHYAREARELADSAEASFRGAVGHALANGVPASRLAEALGLSRARIYQIRDGRR